MVVGKIISIFDISVEVVLENNDIKVGDVLQVKGDSKYSFEVVEISNTSAICISLESTRGLKKGAEVELVSNGIHVEYSDKVLGRIFNSYGIPIDKQGIESVKKRKVDHATTSLQELNIESQILWTGIKVIDFFAPLQKGFKMGLLGGAGVGKTVLLKKTFTDVKTYIISAVRLLAIPLAFIGASMIFPVFEDKTLLTCALCSLAMPLGLNTIVIPSAYGKDTTVAANMAVISHLMALATIPLVFAIVG